MAEPTAAYNFFIFYFDIFLISAAQEVIQNNQYARNVIYSNGSQNGGFDPGVGFSFCFTNISHLLPKLSFPLFCF